jgi:phage terminase small subunit
MSGKAKGAVLADRRERFVAEYIIDLNGKQAAIRAGYSEKTAEAQASRLLRNVKVQEAIAAAKAARVERTEITQDRVLNELALLAFSHIEDYVIDDAGNVDLAAGAPKEAKRAISSIKRKDWSDGEGGHTVEVELKFWDKPGMLRLAGRHVGLFADRMELTGKDGQPLDSSVAKVTFVLPDNGRRVVSPSEPEAGKKQGK